MPSAKQYDNIISRLLTSADDKAIESGLRILASHSVTGQKVDGSLEDALSALSISPNYEIRKTASQILASNFPESKLPVVKKKELNPILNLILPTPADLDKEEIEDLQPEDTVKDNIDPIKFVEPFAYWIGLVSDQCGISEINLAYRTYQIARNLESPEKITGKFESDLREHNKAIDLEYPLPRPRHRLIQRALLYLLAELIDAGALEETDRVIDFFNFFDPLVSYITPIARPTFVKSLIKNGNSNYSLNKEWTLSIKSEEKDHPALLENGYCVIGEYTLNRNQGWGLPTETFMRQLIAEGYRQIQTDETIFGKMLHCIIKEYPRNYNVKPPHLVVTNHFFAGSGDGKKYHWLALNPGFAQLMKWSPASDGLFRWVDGNGNTMVESIYWEDGNIWEPPPHYESITGVGWIVLASGEAMKQIRSVNLPLYWESCIVRTINEEGQEYERSEIFTDALL